MASQPKLQQRGFCVMYDYDDDSYDLYGEEDLVNKEFDKFKHTPILKPLSKRNWLKLDNQFKITPECRFESNNYNFMPSGEHWKLAQLVKDLTGITPDSRHHAIQIAEDVLAMGYQDEF